MPFGLLSLRRALDLSSNMPLWYHPTRTLCRPWPLAKLKPNIFADVIGCMSVTTNRSREYDGNQRRSVYFHRTASSGWDRTCWSICFNLWSRCACLSDTTDSKVKYNKIKGKQMQVHANPKCCTAEFRRGSGRSPVVGQLPSKVKPKANDLDKRHVEGILTSIKSPYCGQDSHGTWKSSRVQEE